MIEKYLPVGSVIMLKNGDKKLMVTGFCVRDARNKDKVFDYCACLYPEGILRSDHVVLFNHSEIKDIFSLGYSDDEEKQFQTKLKNEFGKSEVEKYETL